MILRCSIGACQQDQLSILFFYQKILSRLVFNQLTSLSPPPFLLVLVAVEIKQPYGQLYRLGSELEGPPSSLDEHRNKSFPSMVISSGQFVFVHGEALAIEPSQFFRVYEELEVLLVVCHFKELVDPRVHLNVILRRISAWSLRVTSNFSSSFIVFSINIIKI